MKKRLYNLFLVGILCAGFACGGSTQEQTEGGKAPVSADDPKAPTMAPNKPSTNIGDGLEDSARRIEQSADSL